MIANLHGCEFRKLHQHIIANLNEFCSLLFVFVVHCSLFALQVFCIAVFCCIAVFVALPCFVLQLFLQFQDFRDFQEINDF